MRRVAFHVAGWTMLIALLIGIKYTRGLFNQQPTEPDHLSFNIHSEYDDVAEVPAVTGQPTPVLPSYSESEIAEFLSPVIVTERPQPLKLQQRTLPLADDYWPLVPDSVFTFQAMFKERTFLEVKTLKARQIDETTVFYLIQPEDESDPLALVGYSLPGLGLISYHADGLNAIQGPELHKVNATAVKQAQPFLNYPLTTGEVTKFKASGFLARSYKLTVEVFEDVTVAAGEFKKCAKIHEEILLTLEPSQHGTFWLARGVGLVKWHRPSGRIDELKSYQIPGEQHAGD